MMTTGDICNTLITVEIEEEERGGGETSKIGGEAMETDAVMRSILQRRIIFGYVLERS